MRPFQPTERTVETAVTTSSQAVALSPGADSIRFEAPSTTTVYVYFGINTDTVTVDNGMGLMPGSVETISVPPQATHLLVIGDAAATLRWTKGMGV